MPLDSHAIASVEVEDVLLRLENMQKAMSDASSTRDMIHSETMAHFADCLWDDVKALKALVDKAAAPMKVAA